MPLMTTKPMFDLPTTEIRRRGIQCEQHGDHQGIVTACAAEKAPLILQISKGARKYANMRFLKHIIDAAVEENPDLPSSSTWTTEIRLTWWRPASRMGSPA